MFVHEENIVNKIDSNYKGKASELKDFYEKEYLAFKQKMLRLDFSKKKADVFNLAASYISDYYNKARLFAAENKIASQSKFESTILEEISYYLFHNLPDITVGKYSIYNSGIYAGLSFDDHDQIVVNEKDVDFCIGRELQLQVNGKTITIRRPIIAVEVKTYLDATMFSGIRTFSEDLKNGSLECKTYVLMGYKCLKMEHILYAKSRTELDEMFALCENDGFVFDGSVLLEYYNEISSAVNNYRSNTAVPKVGKLLNK